MFKKRKKLTAIAITSIIFGFGILIHAGILILQSEITVENQTDSSEVKLGELVTLNMRGAGMMDSTKHIKVNFETLEVFAGDTVNISVSAPSASPNLKKITTIIADPDFYFGDDTETLSRAIENISIENIIELLPSTNPPFHATKDIKFFRPNQEVVVYVISVGESSITKYASNVAFTVHSQADKLQVQTNNVILEQVKQQEKTNQIFLGLAWIGVAVIPILVGIDILLRIHFEN